MPFELFDRVRLTRPLGEAPVGALGAIVLAGDGAYEVEVFDGDGETLGVYAATDDDLETIARDSSA